MCIDLASARLAKYTHILILQIFGQLKIGLELVDTQYISNRQLTEGM
jgi:hypothetical protein